jgi:hypothetical protein
VIGVCAHKTDEKKLMINFTKREVIFDRINKTGDVILVVFSFALRSYSLPEKEPLLSIE